MSEAWNSPEPAPVWRAVEAHVAAVMAEYGAATASGDARRAERADAERAEAYGRLTRLLEALASELLETHGDAISRAAYRYGRTLDADARDEVAAHLRETFTRALLRYDGRAPFGAFLEAWLSGEGKQALARALGLTDRERKRYRRVRAAERMLRQRLGHEPSIEAIAEASGCTPEEAARICCAPTEPRRTHVPPETLVSTGDGTDSSGWAEDAVAEQVRWEVLDADEVFLVAARALLGVEDIEVSAWLRCDAIEAGSATELGSSEDQDQAASVDGALRALRAHDGRAWVERLAAWGVPRGRRVSPARVRAGWTRSTACGTVQRTRRRAERKLGVASGGTTAA